MMDTTEWHVDGHEMNEQLNVTKDGNKQWNGPKYRRRRLELSQAMENLQTFLKQKLCITFF